MNDIAIPPKAAKVGALEDLLGEPLLYAGESEKEYGAFHERLRAAVQPRDATEHWYLNDIVARAWEIKRHRRWMRDLIESSRYNGLHRLLEKMIPNLSERVSLLAQWCQGVPDARQRVRQLLEEAGFNEGHVEAHTVAALHKFIEPLARRIDSCSQRIQALLREIERHQDARDARRFREALDQVEDAEIVDQVRPKDALDI